MGPDEPIEISGAKVFIAPLERPSWWRRLLNRLRRQADAIPERWTELGWLDADGLQLGELDDAPPCQDYSAAGRPRPVGETVCPIRPDFSDIDMSKVAFSAEVKIDDISPDLQALLLGDTAANLARQLVEEQDRLIRAAIVEAREKDCGVVVYGEPFRVSVNPLVKADTLIYIPKEPNPW